MQKNHKGIKETILYYPTISIPSNEWLKQAVLYWDEVGSIVPQRYDETEINPYSPEIQYLKDEGEFRPFRTDLIYRQSWNVVQEFENELLDVIASDEFQNRLAPIEKRRISSCIHEDKVSDTVFHFLRDEGLALRRDGVYGWYFFETKTALLYMSLLAKYLAAEDSEHTISSTNLPAYNKLNFGAKSNSADSLNVFSVKFFNMLPVPDENTSFQDILHFKRKRRDELLRFRKVLNKFQKTISSCESHSDLKDAYSDFNLEIETGVSNLIQALDDAKLSTRLGYLESLVTATSPALIGLAAVGTGLFPTLAALPVSFLFKGALAAAGIKVGKFAVDKRNERRKIQRDSPFSYINSAKRAFII